VLEANLIKRHRPRFNASLQGRQELPYIVKVAMGRRVSRVYAADDQDGRCNYFSSRGTVRCIELDERTFQFRKCRGPGWAAERVPTLNYHISRSGAVLSCDLQRITMP